MSTEQQRAEHFRFLEEKIFQTKTKWPHFQRLLDDMATLARDLPAGAKVAVLERSYVYGGCSLFTPLFHRQEAVSIDCQIPTAEQRGSYQKHWTDDARFLAEPSSAQRSITATGLGSAEFDYVIVPNVVHHEPDQRGMFREVARLLKPGGKGLIFEALIRELHQAPDDYVRYTPWGFQKQLEEQGLRLERWEPTGGPFEAIAYCWVQALQYFPEETRAAKEKWFYEAHFRELLDLDGKLKKNLFRKHTSFPVAYSIFFEKGN